MKGHRLRAELVDGPEDGRFVDLPVSRLHKHLPALERRGPLSRYRCYSKDLLFDFSYRYGQIEEPPVVIVSRRHVRIGRFVAFVSQDWFMGFCRVRGTIESLQPRGWSLGFGYLKFRWWKWPSDIQLRREQRWAIQKVKEAIAQADANLEARREAQRVGGTPGCA